jgi:hypothetical protein
MNLSKKKCNLNVKNSLLKQISLSVMMKNSYQNKYLMKTFLLRLIRNVKVLELSEF